MTKKHTRIGGMVILMIASSSLFYSCKKESTKPVATTTTTAPTTPTTSTNSTCPEENQVTATGFKSCHVTATSIGGIYLTIQVYDANVASSATYQQMIFTVPLPQKGVAVQLGGTGSAAWSVTYGLGSAMYNSDATHLGTFTVTSYDETAKKISGTFSFTGFCNASSDTKTFSDGVFTNVSIQ